MLDSIIVGFGIAGLNYAEQLRKQNKAFCVIAPKDKSASHVAAGIINPTVLKRYNPVWKSEEFLHHALQSYDEIQKSLSDQILYSKPIYRILNSVLEQNEWSVAASKPLLEKYLTADLISSETLTHIQSPFGYGEVHCSARIATEKLIETYLKETIKERLIVDEVDYFELYFQENSVSFKNIKAKKIVFCEGFHSVNNPLFNYLPLVGSKGEMLFIESNELSEEVIIKGPIFIVPLGKNQFWVGATFNRTDKTSKTSVEGKNWLIKKLQQNLLADYKIIDHKAQVRATVVDRRPLLGRHPKHQNAYILNGLGTRGVMMSPLLSQWLYEYIEGNSKLPPEVDIKRFENHYFRN